MITHATTCVWEGRSIDTPSEILYSTLGTIGAVPNATIVQRADAFVVFAR